MFSELACHYQKKTPCSHAEGRVSRETRRAQSPLDKARSGSQQEDIKTSKMTRSSPSSSPPSRRRRRRRAGDRIQELESIVKQQAEELTHLLSHLRRVKPQRPRMSSTRSVWLAGKQGFKCAGDKTLCPCWLLRGGVFGPEGWQVDHISRWSDGYDDREPNLRALCATCHFRVTKESILRDEEDEDD